MKKIVLTSLIASSVLMAGGYKIPETSTNGVALSAANIAHNKSADAAYYNPANMVFMQDENALEVDLIYIGLDPVNFKNADTDINAESENFLVPSLNYVSGDVSGARFGLSVSVPGGLSKRWTEYPAKASAEEFTLEVVEINPTVALPIGDNAAIAVGIRFVHSKGVVTATPAENAVLMDMQGDSMDSGYNIALAYKPMPELELGATYRSKVDLTETGDADLKYAPAGLDGNYNARVTVPLPATLSLAMAYTLQTKTTIEFVYERNYWSAYKDLDFDFDSAYGEAIFGTSKEKNWNDTSAYRLGITQEFDTLTLMGGIVFDETPIPDETVGYELPDSDSVSVSLGARYQINDSFDVALSGLYSMRDERTIEASNSNEGLDGEFSNANVLIVSMGVGYRF